MRASASKALTVPVHELPVGLGGSGFSSKPDHRASRLSNS